MAEFDRPTVAARTGTAAVIDEGLRSYMLKVYNYMGIGLVVTGLVSWLTYSLSFVETASGLAVTDLGNLLYNVSNLLNPGGGLLSLLRLLGL